MLKSAPRPRRWRTLAGVLAALLAAPAVAIGSAGAAQADAVRQQQLWVLNAIDVAGAWQHTHGSGVTVALIDSGVNGQVSDLSGSVTTGRDFSGVNTPPTDPNWGVHGTWMASLIAGHGHAGGSSGIMGVAPLAKILSIRAVTDQGDPGYRHYQHEPESRVQGHLAEAINYATSKRVNVISMSLGYQGASLPVRVAISKAVAQGIVVVASSGNSGGASSGSHGNAPYSFPADYPGVLGVGAVAQDGMPAGFSSDNLSVQVAAPGVRVPAQGRDGGYWLVSGTSPACALTAGVAALIKSVYPTLAPALVVQAITASTRDKPQGGYDEQVGFGTVDATAALRMAGRLAQNQGTGHGLVAAAQFGGGPAAIPPVPVAARTNRQFLLDSGIALICLAVVLVVAFRLIVTRKPAAAGVPGGWSGGGPPDPRAQGGWAGTGPAEAHAPGGWAGGAPADARAQGGWAGGAPADARAQGGWAGTGPAEAHAPGGWAGGAPADARAQGGWAGTGPAEARAPGGWAGGAPADARAQGGWAGTGPAEARAPGGWAGGAPADARAQGGWAGTGPPDARAQGGWTGGAPQAAGPPDAALPGPGASGAGGALSDDDAPGYGRSARYWVPGGYKPSAPYPPPTGYGSSDGVLPHADTRPPAGPGPAGPGPAGNHGWPAASAQPAGYGAPEGYQRPTEPGPSPGSGPPADYGPSRDQKPPVGYGPPTGNGLAAGYGRAASPALPGAPGDMGASGPLEALASSSPDSNTGPVAGPGEIGEPRDLPDSRAGDPPAADDDTWPSSGQW
jgi:Subtilase family